MCVEGTQVVGRPPRQRLVDGRVEPQQDGLALPLLVRPGRLRHAQVYSDPVLMTGVACEELQSTTSRFETMAAFRSSSIATTSLASS